MAQQQEGEKTEPPSPKKIRDARAKGQVARSQEVVTTISLLSVLGVIWAGWDSMIESTIGMMDAVADLAVGDFRINAMTAMIFVFREAASILAPIVATAFVAAVVGNYIQIGAIFAFESISPKLEKVNPVEGVKRIFSLKQLVDIIKAILKIVFLSTLMFFLIKDSIGPYLTSLSCGLACQTEITNTMVHLLLIYSAILFIIVALADFVYQRWEHNKNLKMTKQEVKREYKESEGDPHVKGYRKQLAQELVMGDGGERAQQGTAAIVNPTHFAVIIKYEAETRTLPSVTAKGIGHNAAFLRTEAEKAGVPVFRNVKLARALYFSTDVDDFIPSELYDVIAEVLVWVAQNRELLYQGPLPHGVIDMELDQHKEGLKGAMEDQTN